MAVKKEIIVLNGGGHKGVVKITGVAGRDDLAKVSCSLDFRPSGAYLYLIGNEVAKIALKDVNCDSEVRFCANDKIGCVVRSSSLTMFGGSLAKSFMLSKIDEYNHRREQKPAPQSINISADNAAESADKAASVAEFAPEVEPEKPIDDSPVDTTNISAEIPENIAQAAAATESAKKPFVDASSAKANPLGEWTKYDGNNFYYAIKPQLDEMFICYPEEKLLCDTVPNSKWVRVDADDGYYVVGLLYDESEPSFICYGVPHHAPDTRRAPSELESMCVWLPVNETQGDIVGYWIIYQSARTGEIIK